MEEVSVRNEDVLRAFHCNIQLIHVYKKEKMIFLNYYYDYEHMDMLYLWIRIMAEVIKISPRMSTVIKNT